GADPPEQGRGRDPVAVVPGQLRLQPEEDRQPRADQLRPDPLGPDPAQVADLIGMWGAPPVPPTSGPGIEEAAFAELHHPAGPDPDPDRLRRPLVSVLPLLPVAG